MDVQCVNQYYSTVHKVVEQTAQLVNEWSSQMVATATIPDKTNAFANSAFPEANLRVWAH